MSKQPAAFTLFAIVSTIVITGGMGWIQYLFGGAAAIYALLTLALLAGLVAYACPPGERRL